MNSLESFARFIPITAQSPQSSMHSTVSTNVELKARKFTNSLNDCMYEVANEPSLGFYRIQEHVRKSVPAMIDKNTELVGFKNKLKGSSFDLDYSLDAIVKMSRADTTFESIQSLLTDSLFVARRLNIKNSTGGSALSLDSPTSNKTTTKEKSKSTKESLLNFIATKKLSASSRKEELNEDLKVTDLQVNKTAILDENKVVSKSEINELDNSEGALEILSKLNNLEKNEINSDNRIEAIEEILVEKEIELEISDKNISAIIDKNQD